MRGPAVDFCGVVTQRRAAADSDLTVDGDEGQLLTQHAARPPTWEQPTPSRGWAWMPLTTVVAGRVNLVIDDNDSLVPTLVPLEDLTT